MDNILLIIVLVLAVYGYTKVDNDDDKNVIIASVVAVLFIKYIRYIKKEKMTSGDQSQPSDIKPDGKCIVDTNEFNKWYDEKRTHEATETKEKYHGCCTKNKHLGCTPSKISNKLSKEDKKMAKQQIDLCETQKCMEYNEYKNMCGQLDNEGCYKVGVDLEAVNGKEYNNACVWDDEGNAPKKECTIGEYEDDPLESQPQGF